MNKDAFAWGRRAARDWSAVDSLASDALTGETTANENELSFEDLLEKRARELKAYQSEAYARRYRNLVDGIRNAEKRIETKTTDLSEAVARYAFKLMAYKDEYEVARLYTDGYFRDEIERRFEGDTRLTFHLAPPILTKRDPLSGVPVKRDFGEWIFPALKVLAKLRGLRGTALDLFGYTRERRAERALIVEYEETASEVAEQLTIDNYERAVALLSVPEEIRGYGYVKERHLKAAADRRTDLLVCFRETTPARAAA